MIPLGDGTQGRSRSVGCWSLIAANAIVFLVMLGGGSASFERATYEFAAVPGNVTGKEPVVWAEVRIRHPSFQEQSLFLPLPAGLDPALRDEAVARELARARLPLFGVGYEVVEPGLPAWATLLSSMFMHGGWAHILGNMIFLFAFGPRLERRLGLPRFLGFYLATGILAALTHVASDPASVVPVVGASGAISGLLGGYVLLWPSGRIATLIPIWPFWSVVDLPAVLFIGIWVLMQVLLVRGAAGGGGGVAVWAHLGGFVYGLLLVKLFLLGRGVPPEGPLRVQVAPWPPQQDSWERHDLRPWR